MNNYLFQILGISFFMICCSCSEKTIEGQLLQKCIDAHGGLDNWNSLTTTEYTKNITLYLEDGSIEKTISQVHQYSKTTKLSGTIKWKDSIERKITYSNGIAFKTNGRENEENSQPALNTFNSAYYVLNMPWKLLDKGTVISYEGLDTLFNNRIVHTLKVEYPSEEKLDTWEYYLDKEDYSLVANMVHHGSTSSLITNDSYEWYKGLMFNRHRTSYRVDSLGDILFVRAKYEYSYEE